MEELPDLASLSLAEIATLVEQRRLPPVEQWNPSHCGDSEMRIARDGTWYHQGSPIGRPEMVRLFANILRREPDGSYVLVTPVEKLSIAVEDAPFVAVELKADGTGRDAMLAFEDAVRVHGYADELNAISACAPLFCPFYYCFGFLHSCVAFPHESFLLPSY